MTINSGAQAMHINESGLSPESLTKAVAMFYDGQSKYQIALRFGVGIGVIGGRFERAGVVRHIDPGWADIQFDAEASKVFVERMDYGFSYLEAGASLGKAASASKRHAKILGRYVEAANPARPPSNPPRASRPRDIAFGEAEVSPIEPIRSASALGGGGGPATLALISQPHDDAHVAACLAQGGFERYDFATGWTVGPDGDKRWPFTHAAADAARDLIAAHNAGQAA